MSVYIIAEAGVNHNGQIDLAKQLIDVAKASGADAVKFQSFKASEMVTQAAQKANYQLKHTEVAESQFEMIKKLELGLEEHFLLKDYAKAKNIEFLSTPFDPTSLNILVNDLGLKTIKVSSGDLTNAPFLYEIALCAEKVILSTGMSTLSEIEMALGVLAFGFLTKRQVSPSVEAFEQAYASLEGQKVLKEKVSILHCTTEYPAPIEEINLNVMSTFKKCFDLEVGYSDHTQGTHVPIAAVALGATIIEKHFTLDKTLPGPDHQASLEPEELKYMVDCIRAIELSLGDGIKRPMPSEIKNRSIARKSLVAADAITMGETLKISCKRPGNGLSPYLYWDKLQMISTRNYQKDELIES
ncbi:MAG TPA: N-acetylneuraminate synthase [Legionellales bacterium]|nr:N-acetylneuraminate synthase [Legionellales bacterium]